MKQKSLMHRSAFMKRRKILAFLFATMVAVILVGGWGASSGGGISTIAPKANERIVMWADVPADGSPEDYDLLSNLRFAAQKLYTSNFFRGESQGDVNAKVGPIPYNQHLNNMRMVKGDTVFAQTISTSSLVDSLEQQYSESDAIFMRKHESISKNGEVKWKNTASQMSMETYNSKYGTIPRELSKYIIGYTANEDPSVGAIGEEVLTIEGCRDENAATKSAVNADGDRVPDSDESSEKDFDINGSGELEIGFDVPQTLVAGADGLYKFTLYLNPINSTKYYRNEVQTRADANDKPSFIKTQVTVVIDKNWTPVSVTTTESYSIYMMGFNATCSSSITEKFTDVGNSEADIPEDIRSFYKPYIDGANSGTDPIDPDDPNGNKKPSTPIDYLSAAFADYFDGSETLDLAADISADGLNIDDLRLSIDFKTLNIKVKLGKLGVEYSDDKVYITLNKTKGYIRKDKFASLIADERIAELTGGIALPDFGALLEDESLVSTIFENCEMTTENGITRIRLPFTLEGIKVDASLYIKDDGMVLQSISGEIDAFGKHIIANIKPKTTAFAKIDGSYTDLSSAADFIPDAIATAMSERYGICGTVTVNDNTFGINAYIDRADGLAADATITALGTDIGLKYSNGIFYIDIGNIAISGTAEDIPALAAAISDITGIELGSLDEMLATVKKLLPRNIDEWIDIIKSVKADERTLDIQAELLASPVNIALTRANGILDGIKFDVNVDMLGIKLSAAADLALTIPEARKVTADGSYVPVSEITPVIEALKPYIDAQGYSFDIDRSTVAADGKTYELTGKILIDRIKTELGETVAIKAALNALGQPVDITFANNTVYVGIGNVKAKLALSDADRLMPTIDELLLRLGIALPDTGSMLPDTNDIPAILSAALDAIESFDVRNGKVNVELGFDGNTVTAEVDPTTGKISLRANINGSAIDLDGAVAATDSNGITSPDGEYIDIAEFEPALKAMLPILDAKSLSATAAVKTSVGDFTLSFALSFTDGIKAEVCEASLGLTVTVVGDTAYVALGDVKVSASICDIPTVLDSLGDIVPAEIKTALLGFISGEIELDAENTLAAVLGAIKSLSLKDGVVSATVEASGIIANADISTSLDRITANATVSGTAVDIAIDGLTAGCKVIAAEADEYIPSTELAAVIAPVIPLVTRDGSYNFALDFNVFDIDGKGTINVNPATSDADRGLEMRADLIFGDLPVSFAYKNGNVCLNAADSVKLTSGTSKAELLALLDELDAAIPGIKQKVNDVYRMFTDVSLEKILGMISAENTDNGFVVSADTTDLGAAMLCDIEFVVTGGKFESAIVTCDLQGTHIDATVDIIVENGVLDGISVKDARIYTLDTDGRENTVTALSLGLDVTDSIRNDITLPTDHTKITTVTQYIAPLLQLVKDAANVKSVNLDLDAFMSNADGAQAKIGGNVTVALSPALAVYAEIVLFDGSIDAYGSDASETVYLTYVNDTLYVKTGTVMLSFDVSGGTQKLYDILSAYLPEYLNKELAMLLGLDSGTSMFSDIGLLIERFKAIAQADGIAQTIRLLFSELGGTNRNSAIKAVAEMISLGETPRADGYTDLTVMLDALGLRLNVTPSLVRFEDALGNTRTELGDISLSTSVQGMYIGLDVVKFDLSSDIRTVSAPVDAGEYVDVMEFVQAINNAVNTFTAKDAAGNITFEVDSFSFDYDVYEKIPVLDENGEQLVDKNGNPVYEKDDAGRDKPAVDENGVKLIADKITVKNITGSPALRGKFEKYETTDENGKTNTGYKFSLEAHVSLYIRSLANYCDASKPLELSLYVVNNDDYPDGMAVLDYYESKSGYGERISIDYTSVMQLVAAVMDIVGADDETVEMLLGEYRLPIDTTVFDSMGIAGFDTIRDMLNGLATAINDIKDGLGYIGSAWELVKTAGNTDTLRDRFDDTVKTEIIDGKEVETIVALGIKSYISKSFEKIKSAVASFGTDKAEEGMPEVPTETDPSVIDGSLFKMIVNGIGFKAGAVTDAEGNAVTGKSFLQAVIDNAIATQTEGEAHVTIAQSQLGGKTVIDRIEVGNLDVNTAKLNTFDMTFAAGKEIIVTIPDGVMSTQGNRTYSDLANVKHLLFDVMNTANMLEFEIGGKDTSDKINIKLSVGSDIIASLDLVVQYNAKVKIIKVGEDENGKPLYKTAAAIEIYNQKSQVKILGIGSTIVLPECTTNLFFYDDVIYIHGVKDWAYDTEIKYTGKNWIGIKQYDKADVVDYTDVAFTVDELGYMLSDDMNTFLEDFVYLLIPITKNKIAGMVDVRGIIRDQLGNGGSGAKDESQKTIAQIFKGYTYNNGEHKMTIGLAELASSSSLSDVNVSLTGANDGDENIFDNYVRSLHVDTSIQNNLIKVNLDATLRNTSTPTKYYADSDYTIPPPDNAPTEYARNELESTGLSYIAYKKYYPLFTYNGVSYIRKDGYSGTDYLIDNGNVQPIPSEQQEYTLTLEQFADRLLATVVKDDKGNVIDTVNRPDGVQWQRVWKTAYDAAQVQAQ